MSCTYSLPLIINIAPPFSIPYNDDTPVEGKQVFTPEIQANCVLLKRYFEQNVLRT